MEGFCRALFLPVNDFPFFVVMRLYFMSFFTPIRCRETGCAINS